MHHDNDNDEYLPEDDAGERLKRSSIPGQGVKVGTWTTRRTKADTQVFGAGLSLGDPPPDRKRPEPANDNDADETEAPKKKGAVENPLRKVLALPTTGTPEQRRWWLAAADHYEALCLAGEDRFGVNGTATDGDDVAAMRLDQNIHVEDKDDAPLHEAYKGARGLRPKPWFKEDGSQPVIFKGHHAPKPPPKMDDCWDTLIVAAIDAWRELHAANKALGRYQPAIEAVCCHGATLGKIGGMLGYLSKDGSPSKHGEKKGKEWVLAGLDILVALFSKNFSKAA